MCLYQGGFKEWQERLSRYQLSFIMSLLLCFHDMEGLPLSREGKEMYKSKYACAREGNNEKKKCVKSKRKVSETCRDQTGHIRGSL